MAWWRRVASTARQVVRTSFNERYLLATNTVTGGILLAAGDVVEQQIEKRRGLASTYDHARTGRMLVVGLLGGPPHHYWYTKLDKLLPRTNRRSVFKKILADQLVAAPIFAVIFFYGMGLLQFKTLKECWVEFRHKFPMVYLFDWLIWPPTQYVNFVFVPDRFRVLYVNLVTIVWDIFLSYIKHFDELEKENKE